MAKAKYQMGYRVNVDAVQLGKAPAVISNYFNVAWRLGRQFDQEKKTEQEQDYSVTNMHFNRFIMTAQHVSFTGEVKISIF